MLWCNIDATEFKCSEAAKQVQALRGPGAGLVLAGPLFQYTELRRKTIASYILILSCNLHIHLLVYPTWKYDSSYFP